MKKEFDTALPGKTKWMVPLVPFYIITLFLFAPIRLFQLAISLNILIKYPLNQFCRFSAYRSFNSSWHRSLIYLIIKYGKAGYAFDVGLGRSIASFFYLTPLSMKWYSKYEIIVPWAGVLVMVISQLIWLRGDEVATTILYGTVGIGLLSSLFYYCAFESIKYDSLGWALVPFGYYALMNQELALFALLFLAITFFSFSVAVVQGLVWFVLGFVLLGPKILIVFIPGGIKMLLHFRFLFVGGLQSMLITIKAIGLNKSGAKIKQLKIGPTGMYFFFLFSLFPVFLITLNEIGNVKINPVDWVLTTLPVLLYLVNKGYRRFADEQTLYLVAFCSFSQFVLLQNNLFLLPLLWVVLSPMPLFLEFTDFKKDFSRIWTVPRLSPYRITPAENIFHHFFKSVGKNERIFFDFDFKTKAKMKYGGARAIKEYIKFVGLKRDFLFVPDEYLIFEDYMGNFPLENLYLDKSVMGRINAMNAIGARFLLFFSNSSVLDQGFLDAGFGLVNQLDMTKGISDGLWNAQIIPSNKPHLYLLELTGVDTQLAITGELIVIKSNEIKVQLDSAGIAIIKFQYSHGWHSNQADISKYTGLYPWTKITGKPGQIANLKFDYYYRK